MFKFLALVVILAVVAHAYPAGEEEQKPQSQLPEKAKEGDLEAGEGSDLKPAETIGFAYYPSYGYGRGYGYGGYGGWGVSAGYGRWGGYRHGWGYPNGYYW